MELNLAFWLSIVLAASSCFGLLLAGRGKWQGWAVGLATQPVWAWFAIVTKSYGLLLVGLMYTSVYIKNLWQWRKETKTRELIDSWWDKPIGEVASVTEDETGLKVEGKFFKEEFKPSTITTDSRGPFGFYHWKVITNQMGINGYDELDLCVTGVTFTLCEAKRQVRRVERKRNQRNLGPRKWVAQEKGWQDLGYVEPSSIHTASE